jgi:hypothetical protein
MKFHRDSHRAYFTESFLVNMERDRGPRSSHRALPSRGIVVLHITAPGEVFAIGSFPVVRRKGDLGRTESEVWLPVASDVAIGIGDPANEITVRDVEPEVILKINQATAVQSSMFAAPFKPLVEALAELGAVGPVQ